MAALNASKGGSTADDDVRVHGHLLATGRAVCEPVFLSLLLGQPADTVAQTG